MGKNSETSKEKQGVARWNNWWVDKMAQELKKTVYYPPIFCSVAVRAARTHRKRSQLKCKRSTRVVRWRVLRYLKK